MVRMFKNNPYNQNRRSIRLKGYDYSEVGMYFITICCQDRICRFGHVEYGEMVLNKYGQIASDEWVKLSERFANLELDVYQIMPNHLHGIITLTGVNSAHTKTIGDIVGAYKSLVANGCLDIYKLKNERMGKLWQRNYYEHIIRNEKSYQTISEYILNNPVKWADDKLYKT